MPELDEFDQLDRKVDSASDPERKRKALRERGRFKMGLGLSNSLWDMLRAHTLLEKPDASTPSRATSPAEQDSRLDDLGRQYGNQLNISKADYTEHALIGESIRLFVRDKLLSQPGSRQRSVQWLERSLKAFAAAIQGFGKTNGPAQHGAWIHAQAGAASATLFWIEQTTRQGNPETRFKSALDSFHASLAAGDPTKMAPGDLTADELRAWIGTRAWTLRFLGLLHAVRAQAGDFEHARKCLEQAQQTSSNDQSSLDASIALLLGYTASTEDESISDQERLEAARQSISKGFTAAYTDTEDHRGPYAVAMSAYQYYKLRKRAPVQNQDAELRRLKGQVALAREEAWTRAHNTFSQACAELASLTLMEVEFDLADKSKDKAQKAADVANKYLTYVFSDGQLDLETTLLFDRDPLLKALREYSAADKNAAATQLDLMARTW
jgi:hypothetical protein